MREELLRIENITKATKEITVLSNFRLNIFKSEVLGLFSLNDLGKSGLINILCGEIKADSGRIYFDEVLFEPEEYCAQNQNDVFIIDNRNRLSVNLTVADNIFVIRSGLKKYVINNKSIFRQTTALFEAFGLLIAPEKDAGDLTLFERCAVELLKAYGLGAKLIILDDLSSSLSTVDLRRFNGLVQQVKKRGVSFLYIDSELDVLFHISERIVIMRDGKNMRTFRKEEFHEKNVISVLMGEDFNSNYGRMIHREEKEMLRMRGITAAHLTDVSVSVFKGEIISFLDTSDQSNEDIMRLMTGNLQLHSGQIFLFGKAFVTVSEKDALLKGVGLVCENPAERTLFKDWSVVENLFFMMSYKIKWMWAKPRIRKSIIQEYYQKFGDMIFAQRLTDADAATLFKIIYYRWHLYAPKILICVKPFTGLDVYLRNLLQTLMEELTRKGIAIIVLSSNITESYVLGDRVLLFDRGKILGEYQKGTCSLRSLKNIVDKLN
ncbi:MAG: ATP-binding cassette domain-containing protein [Clostridiales bacterium]|jgi:ribose transport system ATP-binding protein|nr:ATP-binding cassette domain-containing protein [Clostridiales bacterium]